MGVDGCARRYGEVSHVRPVGAVREAGVGQALSGEGGDVYEFEVTQDEVAEVGDACGGGGAKVESKTKTTTLGQELLDIDKAFKDGVITEKEYQKAKEALLKGKR